MRWNLFNEETVLYCEISINGYIHSNLEYILIHTHIFKINSGAIVIFDQNVFLLIKETMYFLKK